MSLPVVLQRYLESNQGKATRDELRAEGERLNYDVATIDRALRKMTHAKIIRPVKVEGGFIRSYMLVPFNQSEVTRFVDEMRDILERSKQKPQEPPAEDTPQQLSWL